MSEKQNFESTVFVVDGKTVDANGNEVKAEKAEDKKAAPKADAGK